MLPFFSDHSYASHPCDFLTLHFPKITCQSSWLGCLGSLWTLSLFIDRFNLRSPAGLCVSTLTLRVCKIILMSCDMIIMKYWNINNCNLKSGNEKVYNVPYMDINLIHIYKKSIEMKGYKTWCEVFNISVIQFRGKDGRNGSGNCGLVPLPQGCSQLKRPLCQSVAGNEGHTSNIAHTYTVQS